MSISVNNPPASTGAAGLLQLNNHVISADFTITAGTAAEVTRYVEIAAGITLEIGANADLEIE